MPESELETELVTVGSSDHRHKIDLEVPSLVDSIQSSTSYQGRWENVRETWPHCQAIGLKNNLVQTGCIHKDVQCSPR